MSVDPPPQPRRSGLRRLLNRMEVDQAVFFAVAARVWQFLGGPISILVIAASFSGDTQGYYYTMNSLLGWQTFVELGLHVVVINVASHEWSRLRLDPNGRIAGDSNALERLAGFVRFVSGWYLTVAVLFVIGVGLGGAILLNNPRDERSELVSSPPAAAVIEKNGAASDGNPIKRHDQALAEPVAVSSRSLRDIPSTDWFLPWVTLVVLYGFIIRYWAFTSILEGCNQMGIVNRVRLIQSVMGSVIVWVSMLAGAGLWSLVISNAIRLVWDLWLVNVLYRPFWHSLRRRGRSETVSWKKEIWPLQWRMAIQGVLFCLAFGMFTPVVFQSQGKVAAGRMGMTWQILSAVESAAMAWIQTRTPLFGILASKRDWPEMDRIYKRLTLISAFVLMSGCGAAVGGTWLLEILSQTPVETATSFNRLAGKLSTRMLSSHETLLMAIGLLLLHVPKCRSIYIRSHKQDPFVLLASVSMFLLAAFVIVLGRAYGSWGVAVAFTGVSGAVILPWNSWVWYRFNLQRHVEAL